MFDIAPSEFLLVAFVALVVIGPKDLPKAMRVVGYWVGKARGVARQFRSGFDSMVREAELEEMEKRWASENERIMREHPQTAEAEPARGHASEQAGEQAGEQTGEQTGERLADGSSDPVMVEKPVVKPVDAQPARETAGPDPAKPDTPRGPDLFDQPTDKPADRGVARS